MGQKSGGPNHGISAVTSAGGVRADAGDAGAPPPGAAAGRSPAGPAGAGAGDGARRGAGGARLGGVLLRWWRPGRGGLATSPAEKALGLLAACAAVAMWTWYALANARFLARQRAISPAGWSTAVGLATGAVALAGLPVAALTGQLATPSVAHAGPAKLVAGVVFLGIVVTWVGTWLWNM